MPPQENTNNNAPKTTTFRVGIDPVFKGNTLSQEKTASPVSTGAFNVLNNQGYMPTAPSVPAPTPASNASSGPKSLVRTYKSDMASAIQDNHLSSINIALAESQRLRTQTTSSPESNSTPSTYSKNKIFIFISLILVLLGAAGILAVYLSSDSTSNPEQPVIVKDFPSLITTEYKDELNTDMIIKSKVINVLAVKLNDIKIPENKFYNTNIISGGNATKKLVSATDFVSLLGLKTPDIMKRSLLSNYMVGTYSYGRNLPFIIFKTSSFDSTYAGMLTWESDLRKDLRLLFRLPGYDGGSSLAAELTPESGNQFQDGLVANKDVRLLRGSDGKTFLLYGIIDKDTIIITINETAFKEIVSRLNKEKSLQR